MARSASTGQPYRSARTSARGFFDEDVTSRLFIVFLKPPALDILICWWSVIADADAA